MEHKQDLNMMFKFVDYSYPNMPCVRKRCTKSEKRKRKLSYVKSPSIPNVPVISRRGIAVQTIHVHPVISKYG
jgi:hypothetical protein